MNENRVARVSLVHSNSIVQYIPRNMPTVFALLCFVVVIHWLIFPYPSGLLHWHCGNLTIAPVPAKQPWWIWINTSYEFIMNDCITTTKQSTTIPCAYFLGYTVCLTLFQQIPRVSLNSWNYLCGQINPNWLIQKMQWRKSNNPNSSLGISGLVLQLVIPLY